MSLSGVSTPKFEYDPIFGTPMFLGSDDKVDYFSTQAKPQSSDYPLSNMFSPYPPQDNITPPQTATDPPQGWPYGMQAEQTLENQFEDNMPDAHLTTKIQYGQTTPPDEAVRAPSMDKLENSFPPKPSSRGGSASVSKPTKSTKRSKKSKTEEVDAENDKRSKFLERNRVAASKCRQKKKEYNSNLESRAKDLERQNAMLKIEFDQLQTEKVSLMTHMALHTQSNCNCTAIHQYVANFKSKFSDEPHVHSRSGSIVSAVSSTSAPTSQ